MTIANKLGLASGLLLASLFLPPYASWREPINFSAAVLSFVLALLAAHRGRKVWLAIPCVLLVVFAICICVAMQAY
jgi:hypothetical protein